MTHLSFLINPSTTNMSKTARVLNNFALPHSLFFIYASTHAYRKLIGECHLSLRYSTRVGGGVCLYSGTRSRLIQTYTCGEPIHRHNFDGKQMKRCFLISKYATMISEYE